MEVGQRYMDAGHDLGSWLNQFTTTSVASVTMKESSSNKEANNAVSSGRTDQFNDLELDSILGQLNDLQQELDISTEEPPPPQHKVQLSVQYTTSFRRRPELFKDYSNIEVRSRDSASRRSQVNGSSGEIQDGNEESDKTSATPQICLEDALMQLSSVVDGCSNGKENNNSICYETEVSRRSDTSKTLQRQSSGPQVLVRIYSTDGTAKSLMATEQMTAMQICSILITKNYVEPQVTWSLVEEMPDLHMERYLEDHESVAECVQCWLKETSNRLVFTENVHKYSCIEEFTISDSGLIPPMNGLIYLKSENKKNWKKVYCVIQDSTIMYNSKGKENGELTCLQRLDGVHIYRGIDWVKKYKSPTEHCFALKHLQLQKETPKYIKYFCVENEQTLQRWISAMRVAKCGKQLRVNRKNANQILRYRQSRKSFSMGGSDPCLVMNGSSDTAAVSNKLVKTKSNDCTLRSNNDTVYSLGELSDTSTSSNDVSSSEVQGTNSRMRLPSGRVQSATADGSRVQSEVISPTRLTPNLPITTELTKQLSQQQPVLRSSVSYQAARTSGPRSISSMERDVGLGASSPDFPPPPTSFELNVHAGARIDNNGNLDSTRATVIQSTVTKTNSLQRPANQKEQKPATTAKPQPPPPPKRNDSTKLHQEPVQNSQPKDFMSDLQRVIQQKKVLVSQTASSHPATTTDNPADLPPPSADLLEGLRANKRPPTAPKQKNLQRPQIS